MSSSKRRGKPFLTVTSLREALAALEEQGHGGKSVVSYLDLAEDAGKVYDVKLSSGELPYVGGDYPEVEGQHIILTGC